MKLGHKLPGARTIPEFIAGDKKPYYSALESADASWKKGVLDLTKMEELLKACLAAQLVDVVQQASAPATPAVAPAAAGARDHAQVFEQLFDVATARKLSKKVHHHLKEEEKKFFQVSGKILTKSQKTSLGAQYLADYERMKKVLENK